MICHNCKKENKENIRFCGYCGTPLNEPSKKSQGYHPERIKPVKYLVPIFIILAIVVSVSFFIMNNRDEGPTEEGMWGYAKEENSIQSYTMYIDNFPNGKYFKEANDKLKEVSNLNLENKEWERIGRIGDSNLKLKELDKFIERFNESKRKSEVYKLIDSLSIALNKLLLVHSEEEGILYMGKDNYVSIYFRSISDNYTFIEGEGLKKIGVGKYVIHPKSRDNIIIRGYGIKPDKSKVNGTYTFIVRDLENNEKSSLTTESINKNYEESPSIVSESSFEDDMNKEYGNAKVTGEDIIIRERPSANSAILGSIKYAYDRVRVLDKTTIKNENQGVLLRDITVRINEEEVLLKKDKAVKILSRENERAYVEFRDLDFRIQNTYIDLSEIRIFQEELWYYVRKKNGEKGWVYGKFIELD